MLKRVRALGVKVRFLLLDKGFYSVEVMTYLKRAGQRFIIPVAPVAASRSGASRSLAFARW